MANNLTSSNFVCVSGVFKLKNCLLNEGQRQGVIMLYTSAGNIPIVVQKNVFDRLYKIIQANNYNMSFSCKFIGKIRNFGTTQKRKIAVEVCDFTLPLLNRELNSKDINMDEWEVVEDDEFKETAD